MTQNHRTLKLVRNVLLILLGNAVYALAVVSFLLPSGIITGGTTGLGLSAQHYFNIPLNIFVFAFNLAMFLLGALILGKKFALTTLISTFFYPVALTFWQQFPALSSLTDDPMLCTVLETIPCSAPCLAAS